MPVNIQTLIDERDILRGLGLFARLVDQKRFGELEQVFAPHITFDYGSGIDEAGMEALRALMVKFLGVCGGTQHLIGSILVDVDGDTASSGAYVQARHQRENDPSGLVFDTSGEYRDRWERTSQGWRIVRRDAVWFMHTGDAAIIYS